MRTISEEYKQLNQTHHVDCLECGVPWGRSTATWDWRGRIAFTAYSCAAHTVLDYGSGHGVMAGFLREKGLQVQEYDPGIPGKDTKPEGQFDIVICLDVLEHVEPQYIRNALTEIAAYARKIAFLTISTVKAKHVLPGGVNAHQTVRDEDWWLREIDERFNQVQILQHREPQLVVQGIKELT